MKEIDVTLTDYILALECAFFAYYFLRSPSKSLYNKLWFVFFLSFVVACALGGTYHGFNWDESLINWLIWRAILVVTGVTIVISWALLWHYQYGYAYLRRVFAVLMLFFIFFTGAVLISGLFRVVILFYTPMLIAGVICSFFKYKKTKNLYFLGLGIGWLTVIFAALVQVLGLSVNPVYFTHNATAHVVKMVALGFIFYAAKHLEQTIPEMLFVRNLAMGVKSYSATVFHELDEEYIR